MCSKKTVIGRLFLPGFLFALEKARRCRIIKLYRAENKTFYGR